MKKHRNSKRHPCPCWTCFVLSCFCVHTINKYACLKRDFFFILLYSVCTSSQLCVCLYCPAFCLLFSLTTHKKNIYAPNGIQTRNPSKRSTADPRLSQPGHRDRQDSNPKPQQVIRCRPSPSDRSSTFF